MGLISRARRSIAPGVAADLSKRGVPANARRAGFIVNTRGRITIRLGAGMKDGTELPSTISIRRTAEALARQLRSWVGLDQRDRSEGSRHR